MQHVLLLFVSGFSRCIVKKKTFIHGCYPLDKGLVDSLRCPVSGLFSRIDENGSVHVSGR